MSEFKAGDIVEMAEEPPWGDRQNIHMGDLGVIYSRFGSDMVAVIFDKEPHAPPVHIFTYRMRPAGTYRKSEVFDVIY